MLKSNAGTAKGNAGTAKTDTLVKLVLIFFISLLSFSVGTFVGKQFSDSQYKMAQLEGEDSVAQERDPASLDPASLEQTPPDALTEEDIASLEQEFSKGKTVDSDKTDTTTAEKTDGEKGKTAQAQTAKMETAKEVGKKVGGLVAKAAGEAASINHEAKQAKAKHSAQKTDEKIAEIASKVINGQDPTAHAKTAEAQRAPSSVLPKNVADDVVGKYTVQVSSYANEPDAVEHTKALKDKGFSAFYIPALVKGKTWFRVNVGLYSTAKEANKYRKKILGQDIKSAIVQKIVQN
jgi:cell division septation protein DedD